MLDRKGFAPRISAGFLALATAVALSALLASAADAQSVTVNAGSVDLAQTHVLNADSPIGPNQGEQPWLIGDREALFKVHFVASEPNVAVSRLEGWLTLFNAQGQSTSIALTAPATATTFGTQFDIHPARVAHSFDDSHTAVIPGSWVKPGLTWQLSWVVTDDLGQVTSTQLMKSGPLDVGPPHVMKLNLIDVQWFDPQTPFNDFPTDFFDEMEQKLPVSRLEVRRSKNNVFPAVAMPATSTRPPVLVQSLQQWNDEVGDGEVTRSSRWARVLQQAAGNNYYEVSDFCVINHGSVASGGVGADGYFCSSQDHTGVFWHEFGHSLTLRHWGVTQEDYPYKDPDAHGDGAGEVNGPIPYDTYLDLSTGTRYHNTHVGPYWAFDARNSGTFIPPWVDSDADGTPDHWKGSPMQGGGHVDREPGFHLAHLSDYSINRISTILDQKADWLDADNEWIDDADWAAHGAGWYWTDYTGYTPFTPDGLGRPIGKDFDVYSLLVAGNMASDGGAQTFALIYPPIGPYKSNVRTLYDPRDSNDLAALSSDNYCPTGGCDLSLLIRQEGVGFEDQVYVLSVDWDETKPYADSSSFFEKALNVPAAQGAVLFAELLHTPDVGTSGFPANPTVLGVYSVPDAVPPVLTLDPDVSILVVGVGGTYSDPAAGCTDTVDASPALTITGDTVDTSVVSTYSRTFTCTDASGNVAERIVSVKVMEPEGNVPVIYFSPYAGAVSVLKDSTVNYPEVTCYDDTDPQPVISAGPEVDTSQVGLQTRTYTCQDLWGNTQSRDFLVSVYESGHGTRAEEIYTSITGDSLAADNAQTIADYASRLESGVLTCTDLVDEIVALENQGSTDPYYYFECETDESRRGAEILAAICPEGIANCVLSQDHGQLLALDSFNVKIDRGFLWWRLWTGVGATFEAEDALCLDPRPSVTSTKNCFVNGESDPTTIHPLQKDGSDGYDVNANSKKFEFYNWKYTHSMEVCLDYDCWNVVRDEDIPGYTPVLFQPNFSTNDLSPGQERVDALDMGNKGCWENLGVGQAWPSSNDCYAGYQQNSSQGGSKRGVRLTDEPADWEWGFYENNYLSFVMSIYDGGSSSDFGLNPCPILTNSQEWIDYVTYGTGDPFPALANYQPDFVCNFTEEAYEDLIVNKLSEDEQEWEVMKQTFFDVFSTIATTGVGSGLNAGTKAAAAGTRLAKALKAATAAWETFDTAFSVASLAAEVYVFSAETVRECRALTGADKEACWTQAIAPTLIGLAGDQFISGLSGDFLDNLGRRVPSANADELSTDVPNIPTGLQPKDFQAQVDNTAKRAEILAGSITEHHAKWDDQGIDISGLMNSLKLSGQDVQATRLNDSLWAAYQSNMFSSFDRFDDAVNLGISSAQSGSLDVEILIDYVDNWNLLVETLESGPNPIERWVIENDAFLLDELDRRARLPEGSSTTDWIAEYKDSIDFGPPVCRW